MDSITFTIIGNEGEVTVEGETHEECVGEFLKYFWGETFERFGVSDDDEKFLQEKLYVLIKGRDDLSLEEADRVLRLLADPLEEKDVWW